MRNFVDEYSIDYRDSIAFKNAREKITKREFKNNEPTTIPTYKKTAKKLLATILLFISVIVIAYEVIISKSSPTILSNVYLNDDARKYDDFIFPVVMQDPTPFDRIENADCVMLVSASLWREILSKRIDNFDENGFGIVDEEDMWKNYDELFDCNFHPRLNANMETDFFKFDSSNSKFLIKPYSNQSCYIPYTQECRNDKNLLLLKVGYVSPNDSWRTLKQDRPIKPSPVKIVEYQLGHNEKNGSIFIKSINSLTD